MHAPRIVAILVVLLGLLFQTGLAKAANLTLPKGGRVTIELLQSDAAFHNTLSILSPTVSKAITGCDPVENVTGLSGVHLASQKLSQRGCRIVLDANPGTNDRIDGFPDGQTIEFQLCAQIDADPACEFVWSSNPTKNSDGFDHLRITELFETAYPSRIFRIEWEDLPNGGDNDFNDFVAVVRVDIDTDGDGLWDDWETHGIDTDGDGNPDFTLPGANRLRKDIFVEIDYMVAGDHTHKPLPGVIEAVIAAFANAPVPNPPGGGGNGITLHIDVDQAIPHQQVLNFTGTNGGKFDAVKDQYFRPKFNPRRFAYHYGLFIHYEQANPSAQPPPNCPPCDPSTSGRAEIGGDDFYVSLGSRPGQVGNEQQQAGTLMHELGHNLGLRHGGNDNIGGKPNYISVMNYPFQLTGIPPTDPAGPLTARIDYSPEALIPLNEGNNGLNEEQGIGKVGISTFTDHTIHNCPNSNPTNTAWQTRIVAGNQKIDWNCSGTYQSGVTANINRDCVAPPNNCRVDPTQVYSLLTGYNDWGNLKFDFHTSVDYADGVHTTPDLLVELNDTIEAQFRVLTVGIDIKPDGVPNSINLGSHGVIPVAILSSPTFNAVTAVDVTSLRFGHIGTEPSLRFCSKMPVDVNADGLGDLFCHFETAKADFEIGDVQGVLSGLTTTDLSFMGGDSVRIIGENGHHREHHHEHNREHDRDHDRDRDQKHDERDDRRH